MLLSFHTTISSFASSFWQDLTRISWTSLSSNTNDIFIVHFRTPGRNQPNMLVGWDFHQLNWWNKITCYKFSAFLCTPPHVHLFNSVDDQPSQAVPSWNYPLLHSSNFRLNRPLFRSMFCTWTTHLLFVFCWTDLRDLNPGRKMPKTSSQ